MGAGVGNMRYRLGNWVTREGNKRHGMGNWVIREGNESLVY